MHQFLKIGTLALVLFCLPTMAKQDIPQANHLNPKLIASQIQQQLEDHLYQLPPRVQGHYGIRLYRMTGNNKYANAALVDLYVVTERQAYYACQLNKKGFIKQASLAALQKLGKGPRAKARKKALKPFPEFLFYTDVLLRTASRIHDFGLTGPCHKNMIKALKQQDLTQGLTNTNMIKAWAAQLVNYVYWAKQLGVGDYRQLYQQAFMATYPNNKDSQLSQRQFRNKLYGMTHFIFAASKYYQQQVNPAEFQWILDYFERNIDRILQQATPDIIAEVGISFLLTGNKEHPVVNMTRKAIIKAYNPQERMILSPKGNPSLTLGEHRNVLAIMLLNWPDTLYQGPLLAKLTTTRKHLPMMLYTNQHFVK